MNIATIFPSILIRNSSILLSIRSISITPSSLTQIPSCISLLQSFARHYNLKKGKELHAWMLKLTLSTSPLSITSLINMYSKCNHMRYALHVFESSKNSRNVYALNAILSGFILNGLFEEGFEFYLNMRFDGVEIDKFTFPCAIKSCFDVVEVEKIHGLVFKYGLDLDCFIGSALIHCYLKFGYMGDAYKVFDELPERDVVLWNAMINGYVQAKEFDLALEVFRRMREDGIDPNNFTVTGVLSALGANGEVDNGRVVHGFVVKSGYTDVVAVLNALIDMYGKCNCVSVSVEIFECMNEKDIFSWNTLLSVHQQFGYHHETMRIFGRMFGCGIKPDLVTITTVLPACANVAALMHGREIHRYMIVNGVGDIGDIKDFDLLLVYNALMDMYVKCGSMRYARVVFDKMSVKDVASWNIMIMCYGMNGYGNEALDMFNRMCATGITPDEVTFVGVLSACSHAGLLSQGREYLSQMESRYGVVPAIEHYACVIDMLGRAGKLEEAYTLLSTMPIESNAVVWRSFLAACCLHGNAHLAEVASQRIFELDPEHCGNYVLMSNAYGAIGRYEEVSELRLSMREQNIMKKPGYSWIEVNSGVHVFGTGDRAHPETSSIYASLDSLLALCGHGYTLAI